MTSLSLFRPNRASTYRNDPFALARQLFSSELDPRRFNPAFDVKETQDAYVIEADLPGVKDEDIEVTLEKNRLTIRGSRAATTESEADNYHLYERQYGSFSRTFTLPKLADGDSVEASLEAGVLRVNVPKLAEAKPRKIPVK